MDPRLLDAILKSPALAGLAPLIFVLLVVITREFIRLKKEHNSFQTKVKADKEADLKDSIKGLRDAASQNTVAVAGLTVEIKHLFELCSRIPEVVSDVTKLGEKARRMDNQLQELLNKNGT